MDSPLAMELVAVFVFVGAVTGFCMMLYIAFKAIWVAGRMTANRKRNSRAFQREQIIVHRDLMKHQETSRRN